MDSCHDTIFVPLSITNTWGLVNEERWRRGGKIVWGYSYMSVPDSACVCLHWGSICHPCVCLGAWSCSLFYTLTGRLIITNRWWKPPHGMLDTVMDVHMSKYATEKLSGSGGRYYLKLCLLMYGFLFKALHIIALLHWLKVFTRGKLTPCSGRRNVSATLIGRDSFIGPCKHVLCFQLTSNCKYVMECSCRERM